MLWSHLLQSPDERPVEKPVHLTAIKVQHRNLANERLPAACRFSGICVPSGLRNATATKLWYVGGQALVWPVEFVQIGPRSFLTVFR